MIFIRFDDWYDKVKSVICLMADVTVIFSVTHIGVGQTLSFYWTRKWGRILARMTFNKVAHFAALIKTVVALAFSIAQGTAADALERSRRFVASLKISFMYLLYY